MCLLYLPGVKNYTMNKFLYIPGIVPVYHRLIKSYIKNTQCPCRTEWNMFPLSSQTNFIAFLTENKISPPLIITFYQIRPIELASVQ